MRNLAESDDVIVIKSDDVIEKGEIFSFHED